MSPSCCCNCLCLSSRRLQEQDQDLLIPEDEPNAFDLTWRNYLLPSSCIPNIFKRQQPIRLGDDDDGNIVDPHDELFISPNYYQGRAVRGYLDNPQDWEFDSVLHNDQQQFPEFVTRNPFGRKSSKKKRKHKKHQHHHHNYPRVVREGVVDGDEEEIFSEDIQDAEFLGDDQIAHLAYERSKNMDPYGEEGYIDSTYDRPISQEMQPPPAHKEFYAPKTMPYYFVNDENDEYHDEYHDKPRVVQQQQEYHQKQKQPEEQRQCEASSSSATHIATVAEQAQDLLSERLDDLTDKLLYIRQNMMDINKKQEQEPDNTTLHTLKYSNDNHKGPGSDKTASDMDSIASEALNEYERPEVDDDDDDDDDDRRRRRSGASQYRFPFGGGDSPPFGSDHHPFSYFTDNNNHRRNASTTSASSFSPPNNNSSDDNTPGLNLRGVLDFGKRWLGA
ncbi:hypothetical protein BDB00DRAFT_783662 [Zychaea mexicana]|uniref:uncharacterized protein n=1 Tax=Zychaea mexicana TaxID=64656 RepID=UPI0022FF078E|nr:uncharacterized protein BDB00DRAFT_783662 [Zychaea mexicana]KAI9499073.1 hypothetical protein BDB00DRAFT_783662 [Zychaea mexicana]